MLHKIDLYFNPHRSSQSMIERRESCPMCDDNVELFIGTSPLPNASAMRIILMLAFDATRAYSIYGAADKPIIIRNCWSLKVQIRRQDPDLSRSNRLDKVEISLFFLRASRLARPLLFVILRIAFLEKKHASSMMWFKSNLSLSRLSLARGECEELIVHMKIMVAAWSRLLRNARVTEKSQTARVPGVLQRSDWLRLIVNA